MNNKKWHKSEGMMLDFDTGDLVCLIPAGISENISTTIQLAPDMKNAIEQYVSDIDRRKVKTRTHYRKFKEILNKIPNDF